MSSEEAYNVEVSDNSKGIESSRNINDVKDKKKHPDRGISKKTVTIIVCFVVIAALAITYFSKFNPFKKTVPLVQRTAVATIGNLNVSISGSGPVAPAERVEINPKITGRITNIYFKQGDRVKAGELLFELDGSSAQLNVEQIRNNIAQMQLTVNNNLRNIDNLKIKAPFKGVVTGITPEIGDEIQKNTNVLTITDTSSLKVTVPFVKSVINEISEGQKVIVYIQELMNSIDGIVVGIGNFGYANSSGIQVCDVEVVMDNPGLLKSGMTANVEIMTKSGVQTSTDINELQYVNHQVIKNITGGTVENIRVKENQFVQKGETLIEILNEDLIISSESTNLKMKDLYAQLQSAEEQLSNYKIYSPIDGIIVNQGVKVGDEARASTVMAVIADVDNMQFKISIDELDIEKITTGLKANITVDALAETQVRPLSGEVIEKAVEGTSSNGVTTYPITIKVNESSKLLTGMNVNADIVISDKSNVLLIPLEAVFKVGDISFVRVKSNEQDSVNTDDNIGDGRFPTGQGLRDAMRQRQGEASGQTQTNGDTQNQGQRDPQTQWQRQRNTDNTGNTGNTGNTDNSSNVNSSNASEIRMNGYLSIMMSSNAEYYANTAMKPVQLGLNNDQYVEVISGLQVGEEVVLPPLTTSSGSTAATTQQGFGNFLPGGMGGNISNIRDAMRGR